ncbi:MAG: hypothetical protein CL878_04760, partial [Dehalococcoidia bacterium]|nr:hypothetical protein [Dehalococcoidia bacterium]
MQELLDRAVAGERLSAEDAAALLANGEALLSLGQAAAAVRRLRVPTQQVTFAVGCAITPRPSSIPDADLTDALDAAVSAGCSEVMFLVSQADSGMLDGVAHMVVAAKAHVPHLVYGLAVNGAEWAAAGVRAERSLPALRDAGLSLLASDGGNQQDASVWLNIAAMAHDLGLDAAPTVIVRAQETAAERVAQFARVRDWQDK